MLSFFYKQDKPLFYSFKSENPAVLFFFSKNQRVVSLSESWISTDLKSLVYVLCCPHCLSLLTLQFNDDLFIFFIS